MIFRHLIFSTQKVIIREFFENGTLAFQQRNDKTAIKLEKKIKKLEQKLVTKNEVLSELMEEHIALKKSLGEL